MKRTRHSPAQIVTKFHPAVTELAGGRQIEVVCQGRAISPATYHRWQEQYGGADLNTVEELKALKEANAKLGKLVADGGLGRARHVLVAGDGAPWIWNVAQDRWAVAPPQVLDFYHASQHLWHVGQALHGSDESAVARWVEPRRHQLRHGKQNQVLAELARLAPPDEAAGEVVRREANCFAGHAGRMNYQSWARRGWPIGSGPAESACRQKQCRFKRPGQFWTSSGMRHLGALTEARHNHHWDELWLAT